MTRTYDAKCHDLAAAFLSDEPDINTETNIALLASEIQGFIEDEITLLRVEAVMTRKEANG